MSTSEKAFGLFRTIFTFQDNQGEFEKKLVTLSERLERLADSHVALRDRVSRIEGMIEGAAMATTASAGKKQVPRIEE